MGESYDTLEVLKVMINFSVKLRHLSIYIANIRFDKNYIILSKQMRHCPNDFRIRQWNIHQNCLSKILMLHRYGLYKNSSLYIFSPWHWLNVLWQWSKYILIFVKHQSNFSLYETCKFQDQFWIFDELEPLIELVYIQNRL